MRPLLFAAVLGALHAVPAGADETRPGQESRSIPCPSPCPTGVAVSDRGLWVVDRFTDKIY